MPPAIASARLSSLPIPPGLCSMGTLSTALFMGRFLLMAMSSKYDFVKVGTEGRMKGGREGESTGGLVGLFMSTYRCIYICVYRDIYMYI